MAVPARQLDRENAALRELVTVYRYLSGLALQDADLAGVVRLISERTAATVAVLTQLMDVLTAAASRRVRDDLVEGLLLGRGRDNADASRWAAHLGYDPARDHNVLAIAFELPPSAVPGHEDDAAPRERIRESIEHFVATRAPEAIVSARECEVVVVTARSGPRASCTCTRTRASRGAPARAASSSASRSA